jgi:hypothetical protein
VHLCQKQQSLERTGLQVAVFFSATVKKPEGNVVVGGGGRNHRATVIARFPQQPVKIARPTFSGLSSLFVAAKL